MGLLDQMTWEEVLVPSNLGSEDLQIPVSEIQVCLPFHGRDSGFRFGTGEVGGRGPEDRLLLRGPVKRAVLTFSMLFPLLSP